MSINFFILLLGVGGISGIVEPVYPSDVVSNDVVSKVVITDSWVVVISSAVVSSRIVVVITVVVLAIGGVFNSSVV